jgi:hypothetical protein
VSALDRRSGRRGPRRVVEHRERRGAGRGQVCVDRGPTHRFDGVRVIGVDEHCWRHTRRGDKYVTVIIDLTPIRDGTGPARLLDMVDGRSKQVFKSWLGERDTSWRDCVEVVAMDGFTPVSRPPPARNCPTHAGGGHPRTLLDRRPGPTEQMLVDGFGDQTPVVSGLQPSGSIGCMIANKFPSVSLNHAALSAGRWTIPSTVFRPGRS